MRGKNLMEMSGLQARYKKPSRQNFILGPINLDIPEGATIGLFGDSGCGKSTLGAIVAGISQAYGLSLTPDSVIHTAPDLVRAYIPQDAQLALDPLFTIASQLHELGSHDDVQKALIDVELDKGLANSNHYPHMLSGGMCQRILIACALLRKARLFVADEATSNLDVFTQRAVMNLLQREKNKGSSVLMISHEVNLLLEYSDYLVFIREGHIVEQGPKDSLLRGANHHWTREVLHAAELLG